MPRYSRSRSYSPYSSQRGYNAYSSPRSSFQSGLFGLGETSGASTTPYARYLSNAMTRPLGLPARQSPVSAIKPTSMTTQPMTAQAKTPQTYTPPPTTGGGLSPPEMSSMPVPQPAPQTYTPPSGMMYAGGTPGFNERGTVQSPASNQMYAGGTPNFSESGRPQALGNALAGPSPDMSASLPQAQPQTYTAPTYGGGFSATNGSAGYSLSGKAPAAQPATTQKTGVTML